MFPKQSAAFYVNLIDPNQGSIGQPQLTRPRPVLVPEFSRTTRSRAVPRIPTRNETYMEGFSYFSSIFVRSNFKGYIDMNLNRFGGGAKRKLQNCSHSFPKRQNVILI